MYYSHAYLETEVFFSVTVSSHSASQDVNDNSPVFMSTHFVVSIPENTMVGSTVTQLVAEDPDEGTNGEVQYTMMTVMVPFMIDPVTGTVRTTGTFNYDQGGSREFNMEVTATFFDCCHTYYHFSFSWHLDKCHRQWT